MLSGFHIRADIAKIHQHRAESPTQLTLVPRSAPDPQKVRLSRFQNGFGCRSRFVTELSTTFPAQITQFRSDNTPEPQTEQIGTSEFA